MATKLPSGNYRTQVFIGHDAKGKRKYKSFTAETAKKANLAALQWQSAHPSAAVEGNTLKRAMEVYIKQKRPVLSPSTIRSYGIMTHRLCEDYPAFMSQRIDSITKSDLQTLINALSARYKPKSVRNYHGLISAVFSYNDIPIPAVTLPTRVRPDFHIPDEDTLARLFKAVEGTEMEIPVLLGAIGPLRRGEIAAASIDDLEGSTLHIHRSAVFNDKGKQVVKNYPKTDKSDRYILLPDSIAEKIRKQGYICSLSVRQITGRFKRILDREGIPQFRFHDLRHAFVSISHAAGLPDAYIQERGGWSTNYTMNNVYRHTLDSERRAEQERINSIFEDII